MPVVPVVNKTYDALRQLLGLGPSNRMQTHTEISPVIIIDDLRPPPGSTPVAGGPAPQVSAGTVPGAGSVGPQASPAGSVIWYGSKTDMSPSDYALLTLAQPLYLHELFIRFEGPDSGTIAQPFATVAVSPVPGSLEAAIAASNAFVALWQANPTIVSWNSARSPAAGVYSYVYLSDIGPTPRDLTAQAAAGGAYWESSNIAGGLFENTETSDVPIIVGSIPRGLAIAELGFMLNANGGTGHATTINWRALLSSVP